MKKPRRKRLKIITKKKIDHYKKKWTKRKKLLLNSFYKKITQSVRLILGHSVNVRLLFQSINKGLTVRLKNKQSKSFRSILIKLRSFSKFTFFRELVNILLIVINKSKSLSTSNILSEYLASQLSVLKKHNILITFLKRIISSMLNSNFSSLTGLKISFKGRLNGASRSSIRNIMLGKLPLQTLKESIDHSTSTSFTPNGTIGVKIWLFSKKSSNDSVSKLLIKNKN